ncbi:MAG: S1C family serine protease [Planctomycetota bacterium]|jgi:serine protease Do
MRSIAIALLLVAAPAWAGGVPLRSKKVDAAVAKVQPSVVKIFGAKGFRGIYGYMTGVIVHESGLIITRGSVTLEETSGIRVHLHDGRRVTAEIVREDRRTKMILLRILGGTKEKYPVAPLGDSSKVRAGQFVVLVGNAYKVALGRERCAVNFGMVSAIAKLDARLGLSRFHYKGSVILHDAMNNPGVFGGPLIDLDGNVIGISGRIVESRDTNHQVHYAIPMNVLKPFITDTLTRPGAPRIYAGDAADQPKEIEPEAAGYHGIIILKGGVIRATPAYVDRVVPGSPAAKAGIRPDDLIIKIDESRVKSWKSFRRIVRGYRAGETLKVTLKRGEKVKLVVFKLVQEPRQ